MPTELSFLQKTLNNIGHSKISREVGLTRQAIKHWVNNNRLPASEYLPKDHPQRTNYAEVIAKLAGCKKSDILNTKN